MRIRNTALALLALMLVSSAVRAVPSSDREVYREALELYRSGMYERARAMFETLTPDAASEGYAVLCALKLRTDDYIETMSEYDRNYPSSALTGRIRFENARILFDEGKYGEASLEFSKVPSTSLDDAEMPEYMFKCGYCAFSVGRDPEALQFFTILDALEYSEFTAPGQYVSGVIYYNSSRFEEAEARFSLAVTDPRFTELANFYIVDCEFNRGNYGYVVDQGVMIFGSASAERRDRLARIISESYLILGDADSARQYYDQLSQKQDMNRKDYFYAGTVLYSVHDYQGAIENYSMMADRSDSLGQIANYHLGNAYLRTRNQVAAMESFKAAASVNYDARMTEDASFNYAKLAFDLNKDTSGFADYIKRYSTRARGAQIYGYMALAALYDRDYASAIAAYDNIDELGPDMQNNYVKANFLRGRQLYESGSYRDAVPFFRTTAYYLPKTDRLNQYARYWLGESYYMSGNYQEAASVFTELYNGSALFNRAEGRILPYNIGYCHFKLQDYETAARWFDTYIFSGNPLNREDAMNRRADCDFGRHDYKAAAASYRKVLDEFFGPDDIYPYYQQAISYGLDGDLKRKMTTLMQVGGASPDAWLYSEALYELGRTQLELKMNTEAAQSFSRLRSTTRDSLFVAKALSGLGLVYRNMSDYDKALGYYDELVHLMPGSEYAEEAMMAIESIYNKRRQPEKFLEYLEKNSLGATVEGDDRERVYFNTVEQLYLAGSYGEAVNSALKYLDSFPESANTAQVQFYLAEACRALGQKEKACDWYAEVMKSRSGLSFVEMSVLRHAQLSYELERYQDAYRSYSELFGLTKMDENKSAAATGMMRSAYRCKDYASAVSACNLVIEDAASDAALRREARYLEAKSCLALSRRDEAMEMFRVLAGEPSTPEGAEASYMLVQNSYDTGDFEAVEEGVYNFSQVAGGQSYWLAKAYLVLGDSFADRGNYAQARATYESIRDGYAPSDGQDDIGDSVRRRLERLETITMTDNEN